MQRENECRRMVVEGRRTDDGTRCTFLVVHEVGGTWALYLHGVARLGVRLTDTAAAALATAIVTDGSR